jgi:Family of unknown function (DUF6328)
MIHGRSRSKRPHARHGFSSGRTPPSSAHRSEEGSLTVGVTPDPAERPAPSTYPARGERPNEQVDRRYGELLQEVRVAQTGVQLLLAFLLALAFAPGFAELTAFQRNVYVTSLILGAAATALLMAPAPAHQLMVQERFKHRLVRTSSRFTQFGLALLMLSLSSSLLLILDVVLGRRPAVWITSGVLAWFGFWWYAVPLWSRSRRRRVRRTANF